MEHDEMAEEPVQALRPVNKNNLFPATPAAIAYVAIHNDPSNGKQIILWDDILHGFKDASHARHGTKIIPFLKGSDFKNLSPLRFIAIPNAILDIVVDGQFTSTDPHPSESKLRQIANQWTQFPRYNPIDMLSPTSMPKLSRAVSNAHSSYRPNRTIPPPSFWIQGRRASLVAQPPPRPAPVKPRARMDVREAFRRIITEINLAVLEGKGDGTPEEFSIALECYLVALHQSHSQGREGQSHGHAQLSVGDLFQRGQGVKQDTSRAFEWYLKAASQGNAIAQRKISRLILTQPSRPPPAPEVIPGASIVVVPIEHAVIFPADTHADTPSETFAVAPAEVPTNPVVEAVAVTQESYGKEEIFETLEKDTQTSTPFRSEPVFHYPETVPVKTMEPRYSEKVLVKSTKTTFTYDYSGPAFWELPTSRYSEQALDGSETTDSADTYTYTPVTTVPRTLQYIGSSTVRAPQFPQFWNDEDVPPAIYLQPRNPNVRRSPQLHTGDFEQTLANARYGDITAQVKLGDMHLEMRDAQQDDAAMYWYLKAALFGYADGQYRVGVMFLEGRGVQQSYSRAMEWCLKAANQGKVESQILVGYMYERGYDVVKNYTRAMDWYCKAAAQGAPEAQINIGVMYEKGHGVPKSYSKAMEWYRKAADQGNEIARANLVQLEKKRNPIRSRLKRLLS